MNTKTKRYNVTFHYTLEVEADDDEQAVTVASDLLDEWLDNGDLRPCAGDMVAEAEELREGVPA